MDKNQFDVTVDDSVFYGKRPGLFTGLLFFFCFCIQLFLYIILEEKNLISVEDDTPAAIAAFVVSILITVIFLLIREKKTGGVRKLSVTMLL